MKYASNHAQNLLEGKAEEVDSEKKETNPGYGETWQGAGYGENEKDISKGLQETGAVKGELPFAGDDKKVEKSCAGDDAKDIGGGYGNRAGTVRVEDGALADDGEKIKEKGDEGYAENDDEFAAVVVVVNP